MEGDNVTNNPVISMGPLDWAGCSTAEMDFHVTQLE